MAEINDADILGMLQGESSEKSAEARTLESIDKHLKDMIDTMDKMSQSAVFDKTSTRSSGIFSSRYSERISSRGFGNTKDAFKSGFYEGIADAIGIGSLKKSLNTTFRQIAEDLGVSIEDLPNMLGQEISRKVISKIPSKLTDTIRSRVSGIESDITSRIRSGYRNGNAVDVFTRSVTPESERDKESGSASAVAGKSPSSYAGTDLGVVIESAIRRANGSADGGATDALRSAADGGKPDGEAVDALRSIADGGVDSASNVLSQVSDAGSAANAAESVASVSGAAEAGGEAAVAAESVAGLGGAVDALMPIVMSLGPEILAVVLVLGILKSAISPLTDSAEQLGKSLSNAANRVDTSMRKSIEASQDRLTKDIETMVKTPFEIMEKAAQEWYDTWDSNLRTITATQGYSKAQLQDLMGSFADRLREDGLTSVVSATDITDNLKSVLESGLSGTVAEEFAYLATKLNAAIPTQDFFGYASTYASIAANAIKNGQSETEAIAYANEQLEEFASGLLYASREVAGGFTTGLKDAGALFEQSVQIAQASKTGSASGIAGVLTAVSAITGAIAPDLASSMTDVIYKAAVGGNSSELVALRSLSGINASNTEFLRKLSDDPQGVFSNLFRELAKRQNMSDDAYMEVAEGLSSIFGVASDAFARVDFAYLADAIETMSMTSSALEENMFLLSSGETTTSAEQLKMQQINQQILDQGLAYVLDNEAARAIQQHMWDEQLAKDLQETTYAVELTGSALSFLEGIRETIYNINKFLNPLLAVAQIGDLVGAINDQSELVSDINQIVNLGKIGNGNDAAYRLLTTRNRDLDVVDDLVTMLGGVSSYGKISDTAAFSAIARGTIFTSDDYLDYIVDNTILGAFRNVGEKVSGELYKNKQLGTAAPTSMYNYSMVGKSQIPSASSYSQLLTSGSIASFVSASSSTAEAQERANQKITEMLQGMEDFVANNRETSYADWTKTAGEYGVSNFGEALENAGFTEASIRGMYEGLQTQIASQEEADRKLRQEQYLSDIAGYQLAISTDTAAMFQHMQDTSEQLFIALTDQAAQLGEIYDAEIRIVTVLQSFEEEWQKYFVENVVYKSAFDSSSVEKIQRAEKDESQTAILTLAQALTKNDVNLLVDPTLQTNALLASILQTAIAILNSTNQPNASASLPTSLAGLALGL